ncbi:hypothetical protein HHK36_010873 [Tetracentron sinense]|uniref:Uncharacterized protein n=1 Tax=Tetracentron sinense TaxID=13715 RepID=A0A835DJD9_TETSI|nr:hypothetical protein HHK36_010873 [Tetracentron sinense]
MVQMRKEMDPINFETGEPTEAHLKPGDDLLTSIAPCIMTGLGSSQQWQTVSPTRRRKAEQAFLQREGRSKSRYLKCWSRK